MIDLEPEGDAARIASTREDEEPRDVPGPRLVGDHGRDRERPGHGDRGRRRHLNPLPGLALNLGGHRPRSGAAARVRQRQGLGAAVDGKRDVRRRREDERVVGAREIDLTAALTQHRDLVAGGVAYGVSRQHERGLDLRHAPVGMPLLQERGAARHVWARHARAAQLAPRPTLSGW